jgi:hypothetical protein
MKTFGGPSRRRVWSASKSLIPAVSSTATSLSSTMESTRSASIDHTISGYRSARLQPPRVRRITRFLCVKDQKVMLYAIKSELQKAHPPWGMIHGAGRGLVGREDGENAWLSDWRA